MSVIENPCEFCKKAQFKYTCPKCNAPYCTVQCYKSQAHIKCSEEFYKSCVQEEFESTTPSSRQDMQKIYDILRRMRESDAGFNPEDFDKDGLDTPSEEDELNSDGVAEEGEDPCDFEDDDNAMYEEPDLSTRLQGININESAEVWSRLTDEEKQDFQKLVSNGDIMSMVPDYKPWWLTKNDNTKIIVLSDETDEKVSANNKPKIFDHIPKFVDICKKEPSPCVLYNLWNILAAYSCVVRFFGGEHLTSPTEAIALLVNLSSTLKYGTNFEVADDAVVSVEMEALTGEGTAIVESKVILQEDARQLMLLRYDTLAALSDIRELLLLAKEEAKKQKQKNPEFQKLFALVNRSIELNRNRLQQMIRRIEFMLAYVMRED